MNYLKKLQYLGVDIKDLAATFLSKQYKEPKNMTYCKLSKLPNSQKSFDFHYTFIDRELDDVITFTHSFTDGGHTNHNALKPSTNPFDLEWIKLVYKSLMETNPELAEAYINNVANEQKKYATRYKNNTLMEIREDRMKAIEKLNEEIIEFNKQNEAILALGNDNTPSL